MLRPHAPVWRALAGHVRWTAVCKTTPHMETPSTDAPSTIARAIMKEYTKPSFYGRDLPSFLVDLRTEEGRKRLVRTLGAGTAVPYLSLASTFHTQSEPAYCGLATLAIVLNALQVDPQRVWKTPWRWYAEELLECCSPLMAVKQRGITLLDFSCLARCNGCKIVTTYAERGSDDEYQKLRDCVARVCTGSPPDHPVPPERAWLPQKHLVVSFSRKALQQTGSGHFSPIAAYDPESDSVLVMDTARFKYPPYWAPLRRIYEAMLPLDPDTSKPRGWAELWWSPDSHDIRACCKRLGNNPMAMAAPRRNAHDPPPDE
eukprot:m.243523 g.243523  ORF g.243523 m.243523 type:complete len:316 (-) comp14259_c0_seq1:4596-5543(-)